MGSGGRPVEGLVVSSPFATAFAGRSVLVTGHTGFKGAWLSLWLHRLGARVTGYALEPPSEPNLYTVARVGDVVAVDHRRDLRDQDRLTRAVAQAAPQFVFHLAAQALVREGYRIPQETFEVNVIGTGALLEAVRHYGRPCVVVIITSDKCYENQEREEGYAESDPMGGYDPYSASKGAAELLVASYRRSFFPSDRLASHGVRVATARAGNVIGGGDWAAERIVTDIVRSLVAGEAIPLRNPDAVRPWQHVLEPLGGYLTLATRLAGDAGADLCGPWNFGPREADDLSVRELVERFIGRWGEGSWVDASRREQPHESKTLRLKIDKSGRELGWRPRWGIDDAIDRTVDWYRRLHRREEDMQAFTFAQIEEYEGLGA